MALTSITIEGFKSIQALPQLALRPLNILIGANGAGKSNFIGLFKLLGEVMDGRFQLAVQKAGGAEALLYLGQKVTSSIRLVFKFGPNVYGCEWGAAAGDTLIFENEGVYFVNFQNSPSGTLTSSGYRETILINHPPFTEPELQLLFEKKKPEVQLVLEKMRQWRVYHFHDTSDSAAVKLRGGLNDNLFLRNDAGNLAAFLYRLQQENPAHYQAIRETIQQVAPFFDDFLLRPAPGNGQQILLEWRQRGSDYPFLAHHLSDGTLRFMCLATLLLQPELPATVLIDEPELGLHPYALNVLAGLMRSAAQRAQLIVSTQSVTLVNQFAPEDLLVAEMREGATQITRLDPAALSAWLADYSLGELWEKNVLGGRPTR